MPKFASRRILNFTHKWNLTWRSASRLYRGITAPILMEAPKRAVKFAANDEWGKVYRNLFAVEKMTQSLSILTGATAGATESFVVVPFELVKIRLQGKNRLIENFYDCCLSKNQF